MGTDGNNKVVTVFNTIKDRKYREILGDEHPLYDVVEYTSIDQVPETNVPVIIIGEEGSSVSVKKCAESTTPAYIPTTTVPTGTPVTYMPTGTPVTYIPTGTPVTYIPTGTPVTYMPTGTPVTSMPTGTPVTSMPTGTPVTSSKGPTICYDDMETVQPIAQKSLSSKLTTDKLFEVSPSAEKEQIVEIE